MIDPLKHAKRHTFQPSGSRAARVQSDPPPDTHVPPASETKEPAKDPPPQPRPLPNGMLQEQAERIVRHDLAPVPESVRKERLEELQRDAPELHALVIQLLPAAIESQAASEAAREAPPVAQPAPDVTIPAAVETAAAPPATEPATEVATTQPAQEPAAEPPAAQTPPPAAPTGKGSKNRRN